MSDRVFIDTNVFVYAIDQRDRAKQEKARELLGTFPAHNPAVTSTQVLQEMYVALTRKVNVPALQARAMVTVAQQRSSVQTVAPERILEAIDCSILSQLSFWDALLVVTAAAAGCDELWSEDLTDGQTIRGVTIINPFRRPRES